MLLRTPLNELGPNGFQMSGWGGSDAEFDQRTQTIFIHRHYYSQDAVLQMHSCGCMRGSGELQQVRSTADFLSSTAPTVLLTEVLMLHRSLTQQQQRATRFAPSRGRLSCTRIQAIAPGVQAPKVPGPTLPLVSGLPLRYSMRTCPQQPCVGGEGLSIIQSCRAGSHAATQGSASTTSCLRLC